MNTLVTTKVIVAVNNSAECATYRVNDIGLRKGLFNADLVRYENDSKTSIITALIVHVDGKLKKFIRSVERIKKTKNEGLPEYHLEYPI